MATRTEDEVTYSEAVDAAREADERREPVSRTARSRKPRGSHKFLHMIVCDWCGHKENWEDRWTAMVAHLTQHQ